MGPSASAKPRAEVAVVFPLIDHQEICSRRAFCWAFHTVVARTLDACEATRNAPPLISGRLLSLLFYNGPSCQVGPQW